MIFSAYAHQTRDAWCTDLLCCDMAGLPVLTCSSAKARVSWMYLLNLTTLLQNTQTTYGIKLHVMYYYSAVPEYSEDLSRTLQWRLAVAYRYSRYITRVSVSSELLSGG